MKFSFIIPTKNEGGYLEDCIKSIKTQKIKNHEIIVVDSYSTDGTVKIAEKYDAKVAFEKRPGAGVARNRGAKMASGDILVFADADVRFERDFLDKISKKFSITDLGGAIFRLELHDANSKSIWLSYKLANCLVNVLCRLGTVMTLGSCFAFERKAFDSVGGFDPELITNEDHDIARRIAKKRYFRYFHDIAVRTSCRRAEKTGLLRLSLIYIKSSLVYFLNHKSLRNY